MSEPLTFGEIQIGEHFIGFPRDGDDSGHGGYRGAHRVFEKISHEHTPSGPGNAVAIETQTPSHMPPGMLVLKVLI